MTHRFHRAFSALAALALVTSGAVALAGPASATEGETPAEPISVLGDIEVGEMLPAEQSTSTVDANACDKMPEFTFTWDGKGGFTATLSGKHAPCEATSWRMSSYLVPKQWDGKGWNATATPQQLFKHASDLVFPAGQTGAVTGAVPVPDCGSYQADLYGGPSQDVVTHPEGNVGFLAGGLVPQSACAVVKPKLYLTVAARLCESVQQVTVNEDYANLDEAAKKSTKQSVYGSNARVTPATEAADAAFDSGACAPLSEMGFSFGTAGNGGKINGLSVVGGADLGSATTAGSDPDAFAESLPADGSGALLGSRTVALDEAQELAGRAGNLWVSGDTNKTATYDFVNLRCSIDHLNGDNLEFVKYEGGSKHEYCFAYYVEAGPRGAITITKQAADAGTTDFPFTSSMQVKDNGAFTLKAGKSIDFTEMLVKDYNVAETVTSGWKLTSAECVVNDEAKTKTGTLNGTTLTVKPVENKTVTCTFTNEKVTGGGGTTTPPGNGGVGGGGQVQQPAVVVPQEPIKEDVPTESVVLPVVVAPVVTTPVAVQPMKVVSQPATLPHTGASTTPLGLAMLLLGAGGLLSLGSRKLRDHA